MSYGWIFTVIWTTVALLGIWVQVRAIRKSQTLVEVARSVKGSNRLLLVRLNNDLKLYRVRLALIANNLLLGTLTLLQAAGELPALGVAFASYATLTVLTNESALTWLAWRDERSLRQKPRVEGGASSGTDT